MMTEAEMNALVSRILDRLDEVNYLYIQKVAAQVKKIGELNQSSINRLLIMAEMGADISVINRRLMEATELNARDLYRIYDQAVNDVYTDQRFKAFLSDQASRVSASGAITNLAQSIAAQTASNLVNISNTTAVAKGYQSAVDRAIYAVSSGLDDYRSATRQAVRDLGYSGLQVYYESGYHRRLDSAIRQNIIDGTNQLAQNASLLMGETLGMDAVEISAHARSAPDHEPVQGRVFLRSEFDKMQTGEPFRDIDGNVYAGFPRSIGEWNCMHIALAFDTKRSVRMYSDAQLAEWKKANDAGCEIDGQHYTTYQAVQYMRQLETEVRREKDAAIAAKAAGDRELQEKCQRRINALSARYSDVAKIAGITPRRDRMSVDGFRAIKVK